MLIALPGPFLPCIGKGLSDHLIIRSFVNADIITADTTDLTPGNRIAEIFNDSFFVTSKDFARANLIVFPKFFSTG